MMNSALNIILKTQEVSKHIKNADSILEILTNINLSINQGESLAITGSSGSGKTTLLGLLAGLDLPSSGRIILNGIDITKLDEDGRAKIRAHNVGFIFQSFHLIPSLTALENVLLPLELADAAEPHAAAMAYLEQVDLSHRMGHYPNQLSGGEQQRVAIARAFAARPKILFADEVTGNLDKLTGERIIELLFKLNSQQGATLVLVTHDDNLAARCQRRIVLSGGRIIHA